MLSANNQNNDFTAEGVAKQRETIKKLTVGVSSILLGLTFAGVTNAHADTNAPVTNDTESNSTVSADQVINANANTQVLKTATNSAADSAVSANADSAVATSAVANQSAVALNAASAASAVAENSAANDVKTPVADSYEAAVNAAVDATSANTKVEAAATSAASDAASSATVKDEATSTDDLNSASAVKDDEAAKTPAPEEQLEVAPVQMTQYDAQPYSEAQREANAQAGQQIVNDVVSVFTATTISGKIGAGINFVKDTISLIARHPLAYQRYQNMTARQIRYANRQHDLAMKELKMKQQHKPQWQINFVIWQQRQLSNWQHNLEIQRQTMIGYLKADINANANAFA